MAVVVDEPEAITLTSDWPDGEGFLESVVHEVIEHLVPRPDQFDRLEHIIQTQLDESGNDEAFRAEMRSQFVGLLDLMGHRKIAMIDAAIRLTEPVKAAMVQAMQENWSHNQFEKALGVVAADYTKKYGKPDLRVSDGQPA